MTEETHEPQSVLGPEKIEWRGLDSKVFEKLGQPGEYQLIGYEQPVHWMDTEGKLQDIDLNIVDNKVDKCCYIAEIMTDNFGLKMQYRDTGQKFEIILKDIDGIKIRGRTPDVITNGNVAEWKEVVKDLDIVFEFQQDQVRIFRKLKTKDAPVKIHFETITEERQGDEQVHVNQKFFGVDAKGREVILDTTFEEPETIAKKDGFRIVKQQIYDKFTKQIINIDEKTRVRTPGDDVEYPVMIDPVVGFKIKKTGSSDTDEMHFHEVWTQSQARAKANTSEGTYVTGSNPLRLKWSYIQSNGEPTPQTTGGDPAEWRNFYQRFQGITIPMGATINSATLRHYYNAQGNSTTKPKVEVKAINAKISPNLTFASPTLMNNQDGGPPDFIGSIYGKIHNRTDFVKTTGSALLKATQQIPYLTTTSIYASYATPSKIGGTPVTFDVQAIIQRLVDQFDYNNEDMFFDVRLAEDVGNVPFINANAAGGGPAIVSLYRIQNNGTPSATSYGQGQKVARLLIDFSAPVVPETTILADAMLLYQGAVHGQCGVQPW